MHRASRLKPKRKALLRSINFPFQGTPGKSCVAQARSKQEASNWDDMFQVLQEFHKEHNHYCVPDSKKKLQNWLSAQRRLFRDRKLHPERKALIQTIGFPSEARIAVDPKSKESSICLGKRSSCEDGREEEACRVKRPRVAKSNVASYSETQSQHPKTSEFSESEDDKPEKEEATETSECSSSSVDPSTTAPSPEPPACLSQEEPPMKCSELYGQVEGYKRLMPLVVGLKSSATDLQQSDCADVLELMLQRQTKNGQACARSDEGLNSHLRLMSIILDIDEFACQSAAGEALVWRCEMFLKQNLEQAAHKV